MRARVPSARPGGGRAALTAAYPHFTDGGQGPGEAGAQRPGRGRTEPQHFTLGGPLPRDGKERVLTDVGGPRGPVHLNPGELFTPRGEPRPSGGDARLLLGEHWLTEARCAARCRRAVSGHMARAGLALSAPSRLPPSRSARVPCCGGEAVPGTRGPRGGRWWSHRGLPTSLLLPPGLCPS